MIARRLLTCNSLRASLTARSLATSTNLRVNPHTHAHIIVDKTGEPMREVKHEYAPTQQTILPAFGFVIFYVMLYKCFFGKDKIVHG